jgi:hypothetical protein
MNEQTLRRVIRQEIKNQDSLLFEQGGIIYYSKGEFYDAFIGPWINVLKVIKNESQKTLANVKTSFQLFFTFNQKKATMLLAKNRDRVKKINADTNAILKTMPINAEFAAAAFIMNPGAYLLVNHGPEFAAGTVDYLKGAGFGDFLPDESNYEAEKRKEDDKGPIGKALSALNQIFLLAGASYPGETLLEQEAPNEEEPAPLQDDAIIPPDLIMQAMEESGDLKKIEGVKKDFLDSIFIGKDSIESLAVLANSQMKFLSNVASSTNLEELNQALQEFKTAAPEAELGGVEKLPETLKKDAENIANNEKAMKKIKEEFLKEKGIEGSESKKGETEIDPKELQDYVDNLAFGQAMAGVQNSVQDTSKNLVKATEQYIDEQVDSLWSEMKKAAPGVEINTEDPMLQKYIKDAKQKIQAP